MPTPLTAGNIIRATMFAYENIDKQLGLNILHYKVSALVGTTTTDKDMADQLASTVGPDVKLMVANNAEFLGFKVQIISPAGPSAVTSNMAAGSGTGGANMAPGVACPIITWRTGFQGRRMRGRAYAPFLPIDHYGPNGQLNITGLGAVTAYAGAVSAFATVPSSAFPGDSATVEFSLFHRSTVTVSRITDYLVSGKVGNQHRRGDYGKLNARPVL